MNRKRLLPNLPTILIVVLLIAAQQVWASPLAERFVAATANTSKTTINYQGYLTDSGGIPVTDTLDIVVRLYAVDSGGTALWTETHNGVLLSDGLFSLLLGSVAALDQELFVDNENLWIGVTVGSDEEMTPREQLSSAPFALASDNVPAGVIVMWSGTLATIPDGWSLCDGSNSTPDLRDRFIASIVGTENPGGTGGDHLQTLSVSNLPSHTHSFSTNSSGSHTHDIAMEGGQYGGHDCISDSWCAVDWNSSNISGAGAHSHSGTTNATGSGSSFDIRPKFYKLAFIRKQ